MKKLIALLLALVTVCSLVGCTNTNTEKKPAAMSYADFLAADLEAECTVEFYVQATQGWWFDSEVNHGKITIYGQSTEGGYFAYEVNCDEETSKKLTAGTKVRIKGEKAVFNGEVEVMNGTLEVLNDAAWVAEPLDVTSLLGAENLADHMNKKVAIKGAKVVASKNADGTDATFLYKWNGAGKEGDDLYFNVSVGDKTYTMVVESYLCGLGTDTYEAVRGLKVGDEIDMEAYLYWYDGAQPHVYKVTKK